jgi:hypothetical protein
VGLGVAALAGFVVLFQTAGLVLAAFLLLLLWLRFLANERWHVAVIGAIGGTVAVEALFGYALSLSLVSGFRASQGRRCHRWSQCRASYCDQEPPTS